MNPTPNRPKRRSALLSPLVLFSLFTLCVGWTAQAKLRAHDVRTMSMEQAVQVLRTADTGDAQSAAAVAVRDSVLRAIAELRRVGGGHADVALQSIETEARRR